MLPVVKGVSAMALSRFWRWLMVIMLGVVVCAVWYMYHSGRICPQTILTTPQWVVGDWFEIDITMRSDFHYQHGWGTRERRRYSVVAKTQCFGYPCYVLQQTYDGHLVGGKMVPYPDQGGNPVYYYLRTTDLALIEMTHDTGSYIERFYGPVPMIYIWDFPERYRLPIFPVTRGDQRRKVITIKEPSEVFLGYADKYFPSIQDSQYETIVHRGQSQRIVRIDANDYTFRWVPGQLWWAQCWMHTSFPYGSVYRAALVRTSRDGWLNYPLPRATDSGRMLE